MHFVAVKMAEQQARGMLFRTRDLLVRQRTQTINALRGHLAEFGVIAPQGVAHVSRLASALADPGTALPGPVRELGGLLLDRIADLDTKINGLEKEIRACARRDGLMADVDTALEQQIFDLSHRQRVADIYHHREADDLGRTVDVAERIVHRRELRDLTFQLNPIYSDIASAPNNSVFVYHYNNHCYHESIGNVTQQMPTSGDTPQSLNGDKNQNTNHPKSPLR